MQAEKGGDDALLYGYVVIIVLRTNRASTQIYLTKLRARALPLICDTVLLGSIACVVRWFWVVYELHAIEQFELAMKAVLVY